MVDDMDRVRSAIRARKERQVQEYTATEQLKKENEQRAQRQSQQLAKWRHHVRPMISTAVNSVSNDAAREGSEFLIAEVVHGREEEGIAFVVHESGKSTRFPVTTLLFRLQSDGLVHVESKARVQMPAPLPVDTVSQEWARTAAIAVLSHVIDPRADMPNDDEGMVLRVRERH